MKNKEVYNLVKKIIEDHRWNNCIYMKNGCCGCMMTALLEELYKELNQPKTEE